MKNFYVQTDEQTFPLVQKIALSYGYEWINWMEKPNPINYCSSLSNITFNPVDKQLCRHDGIYFTRKWICNNKIELKDLIDVLEDKFPKITIDNNVVEFREDSIKVGCTTVSKETVKQIAEKMGLL